MRSPLHSIQAWVVVLVLAAMAALLGRQVQNAVNVAAVQDAVYRGWEISYSSRNLSSVPAYLPDIVDAKVYDFLIDICKESQTTGDRWPETAKGRNRGAIYRARFHALFRGTIREIHINYPAGFDGDLGAALARFPKLRRLTVFENDQVFPTDAQWKRLCTHLRKMPELEEIELGGGELSDDALTPLAGHPKLLKISITCGHVTAASARTFSTIPKLSALVFEGQFLKDRDKKTLQYIESISPEGEVLLRAAMPNVRIDFK